MQRKVKKELRKLKLLLRGNQIMINDQKFLITPDLVEDFGISQNNQVEPELIEFIRKNLGDGDSLIDVGANLGIFSMEASKLVGPNGKVLIFEPNYRLLPKLINLLEVNKCWHNSFLFSTALSSNNGFVKFSTEGSETGLNERGRIENNDENSDFGVYTVKLDDILNGSFEPTFVKIDVEGAEQLVLDGAKNLIVKCRPVVCLETHGLYFDDMDKYMTDIFSFFESKDYLVYNLLKREYTLLENYLKDTGAEGFNHSDHVALRTLGYGHIIFIPREKENNLSI